MKPNGRRMWQTTEWTLATAGALALGISFAHASPVWELCGSALLAAVWYGFYSISLARPVNTHRTARRGAESVLKPRRQRGAAREPANLPSRTASQAPAKRDPLPQKFVSHGKPAELLIDGIPASRFTKLDPGRFIQ